jgi:glycosyltransferase involved in cell wall biosynthesis
LTGLLRTAWRVLRHEGWAAGRARALDRLADRRRRALFTAIRPEEAAAFGSSVLDVLATPPDSRLGGVPIQMRRRWPLEARERPAALLYREGRGWRLELEHAGRRGALGLGAASLGGAVQQARRLVGARLVHFEGLAGHPLDEIAALGSGGARLVVSLHDITLLGAPHRKTAAEVLEGAEAVVHASAFLRAEHRALVPGSAAERHHVIEPGTPRPTFLPPRASPGRLRHLAYVGAVNAQKGALVFGELVAALARESPGRFRFSVFGGGEPRVLDRLRLLPGVHVRGYYRDGDLPQLLRAHRVDVALLLSVMPEGYSLTLDECVLAGVPVLGFDHGALGERVGALRAGAVVPLAGGAAALRDRLDAAEDLALAEAIPRALASPASAARAYLDLYANLLGQGVSTSSNTSAPASA